MPGTANTTPAPDVLFTPVDLGAIHLKNRIAMAPLTRLRADEEGVPNDLHVEYYRQRASTGMIVAEGTWPVREGSTWTGQPGIETPAQVTAWRRVTDAVHAEGGTIVLQIMHGGRISHPAYTRTGRTVAPSAIAGPDPVRLPDGSKVDAPIPHELTVPEIAEVVEGFVRAARNAIDAGFDGVQIHGANGYLIHQFLSPASNRRTDEYGGSPENRARLAVEVMGAVAAEIGADRTALRLSPEHNIQGAEELDHEDALATYRHLADQIAPLGIAFLAVLHADPAGELVQGIRHRAGAPFVVNSGFSTQTTRQDAAAVIERDLGEAVGVGRALIANPDLVERWRRGLPENAPDASTFYSHDARGYTDYPTHA